MMMMMMTMTCYGNRSATTAARFLMLVLSHSRTCKREASEASTALRLYRMH
jgi:hypothetical protein